MAAMVGTRELPRIRVRGMNLRHARILTNTRPPSESLQCRLPMLGHAPYQPQQPPQPSSAAAAPPTTNAPPPQTINPADPNGVQQQHPPPGQPQPPGTFQTLRLRDEPPAVTPPAPSRGRKRKSPPNANADAQNAQTAPPPPVPIHPHPGPPPPGMHPTHLPPPHALMHPMGGPPPGYPYPPPPTGDYTPGGMPPPPHHLGPPGPPPLDGQQDQQDGSQSTGGRTLSQSKRAEQNRKAQRAFRERRDQYARVFVPVVRSVLICPADT